jgi:hypothetical protein
MEKSKTESFRCVSFALARNLHRKGRGRTCDYSLERRKAQRRVNTTVVAKGYSRRIVVQVTLIISDLATEGVQDCSIKPFDFSIRLRMIGRRKHL